MKLKEQLLKICNSSFDDKDIENKLVDLIYDLYKDKTLELFLTIQDRNNKRTEVELSQWKTATEVSMHEVSFLVKSLLTEKTSRKAKDYVKYMFDSDSIASMIDIMKVYFPNARPEMASSSGRWFYNKFVGLIKSNRTKYEIDGEDRQWLVTFEHAEYVDKILNIIDEEKIVNV